MPKSIIPLEALKRFVAKYPTQRQAAAALGISDVYMSDMLAGNRDVSDRTLERLGLERIVVVQKRRAS